MRPSSVGQEVEFSGEVSLPVDVPSSCQHLALGQRAQGGPLHVPPVPRL